MLGWVEPDVLDRNSQLKEKRQELARAYHKDIRDFSPDGPRR